MKVVVKKSGFYGGDFYHEGKDEQEMPDAIAAQYMAPYGDQLEKPRGRIATKISDKAE